MSFQTPITIKRVLERIQAREYVLPAIQREFVWGRQDIALLFDSLLRKYPIGSFLFWRVQPEHSLDFRFYEFMTKYHERDFRHNPILQLAAPRELTAILDGQQRLSALAIGLTGSHTEKLPRKWANNPDSFPTTYLFCELCHEARLDEPNMMYRFEFLTEGRAADENENFKGQRLWYPVKEILGMENGPPLLDYLHRNHLEGEPLTRAFRTIDRLWNAMHSDLVISYHEEDDQDIDRVLDIFIRVNSGGTKLSYSDLLLSIATAQWKDLDAREALHSLVDDMNRTGQGFNFSKDLVLKSALVLKDVPNTRFNVKNFTHDNMQRIEAGWPRIETAMRVGTRLLASFGFSDRTLVADSVLIPVADYLHMRGLDDSFATSEAWRADRLRIKDWVTRSLLKAGIWGSALDTLLIELRKVIRERGAAAFPVRDLESAMARQGKSLRFTEEEIDDLADMVYGSRRIFPTLALLYPGVDVRNEFHIDHVFPRSLLKPKDLREQGFDDKAIDSIQRLSNGLPNLQLLEGPINESKQAQLPSAWAESRFGAGSEALSHYLAANDLVGLPEDVHGFIAFAQQRRESTRARLVRLLESNEALPDDEAQLALT